jgi:hypothetical protein
LPDTDGVVLCLDELSQEKYIWILHHELGVGLIVPLGLILLCLASMQRLELLKVLFRRF